MCMSGRKNELCAPTKMVMTACVSHESTVRHFVMHVGPYYVCTGLLFPVLSSFIATSSSGATP